MDIQTMCIGFALAFCLGFGVTMASWSRKSITMFAVAAPLSVICLSATLYSAALFYGFFSKETISLFVSALVYVLGWLPFIGRQIVSANAQRIRSGAAGPTAG